MTTTTTTKLKRAVEASDLVIAFKDYGVSQVDLATVAEVDPKTVYAWKAKSAKPRATACTRLDGLRDVVGANDHSVGDDYAICQELSDAARAAGLDGVLAPSAGLAGQRTIALFPAAVDGSQITEQHSRVQVPPIDLVEILERVRPTPAGYSEFHSYVARLRRLGRAALRQYYRRRAAGHAWCSFFRSRNGLAELADLEM